MFRRKTQTMRILEGFLTAVIIISAFTLVASGVAISKVNTDYMEKGVRAAKIIAERDSMQISVTTHEGIKLAPRYDFPIENVLKFLPPPVNTTYFIIEDLINLIKSPNKENDAN